MLIRKKVRRVSIIVQLSVAFTLIIGDHLELNRNHMNHVQHDSSRGPQPTYDWDYNVYTMVIRL